VQLEPSVIRLSGMDTSYTAISYRTRRSSSIAIQFSIDQVKLLGEIWRECEDEVFDSDMIRMAYGRARSCGAIVKHDLLYDARHAKE
jgi:hypothetical protein